jgi:PAS domain S-box-containing protein
MFSRLLSRFGLIKAVLITSLMVAAASFVSALVINTLIGRLITLQTVLVSVLVPFFVSFPFLYSHFSMIVKLVASEKLSKKSETDYRNLISNIPGVVFRRNRDWTTEIISEYKELFGYTKDEINSLTKGWLGVVHPEDIKTVAEQSHDLSLEKDNSALVYRIRAKNGDIRWVQEWKNYIYSDDKELLGVEGIIFDITTQHNMEESLHRSHKLESVGILAGGIAHDFNNIVAAILGNLNLALLDSGLKEKTRKFLSEAEKACLRAKDMTQQLLTFSKGGDPVKEVSSLDGVIRDSANFIIHGHKVACSYVIPEDLWLVDIDKGQISQVIQNIVLNASHAMPEGGIIEVTCANLASVARESIPFAKDGKFVKISIHDSGIGMPAKVMEKIFDPYFSTKREGSGLGLAITQSIISKHNGHITVESSPGVGSTFTVFLPASEKSDALPTDKYFVERLASSSRAKILIMDDEEPVRTVASEMLIHFGHEVACAVNGEEAVKLFRESMHRGNKFDLIIMDLTIPGAMGGKEAVQEVLALDPSAKVVVSSGYSNDPILANYTDYGFCSAIAKPYQLQELSRAISRLIDS